MFLSDMFEELIQNAQIETPEDETYLLLFLFEVCMDEIRDSVPRIEGKYCIKTLRFKIAQLNNILNLVKNKTGTELYEEDALIKHVYKKGKICLNSQIIQL